MKNTKKREKTMASAMQALQKCLNQSSVRSMRFEHDVLDRLSKKYRHFPHDEMIFYAVQDITDHLFGCDYEAEGHNRPASVNDLKKAFNDRWKVYQQLYISYGKEIGREDKRLKHELEPKAAMLIHAHSQKAKGGMAIDFSSIEECLPEIEQSTFPEPIKEALFNMGVSRGLVKDYREEATLRRTQLETFKKWRKSSEFAELMGVYSRLRKEAIRNSRRTKAMNAVFS